MFRRKMLVGAALLIACLATQVDAGEISGVVVYRDGSKAGKVAVSGLTSGAFGGITGKAYTDSQGRFRLTWSSNTDLAKVFVKGSTVAKNVKSGSTVRLTIK